MDTLTEAAHRRHAVHMQEDVGALRRAVADMASGRPGVRCADVELVATELATNLVRHTSAGGFVLYRPVGDGIELLAVDEGPGLRTKGASPASGPGLGVGLGVIERLARTFDLYSTERGTVVLARLCSRGRRIAPSFSWGAVNVPRGGDGVSGDGWSVAAKNMSIAVLLVDALGHGTGAHEVSQIALNVFSQHPPTDLRDFLRRVHKAIGVTRGAVLGVCTIDAAQDRLTYGGVGNIAGRVLLGEASRSLLSREGTLGTEVSAPTVDVVRDDWAPGAVLVLASDGLRSQWDPRAYPRLLEHDPSVVAATLYRDHARATDDATVLCVKDMRGRGRGTGDARHNAGPKPQSAKVDPMAKADLEAPWAEVADLRQELDQTNRGLIALYAELDEARAAEARLAMIVQSSDDAIFSMTPASVIDCWNPGAERLLGYTAADIVGAQVDVLFPSDVKEEFEDALARLRAGARAVPYDTWCRRCHGSMVEVAVTLSAMRDPAGRLIGYSALLHDLSAQRRREAELLVAEATREVTEDRERIARDLHDLVIQRVFAADLALQAVGNLVTAPDVQRRLHVISGELDTAISEIRSTIFGLKHGRHGGDQPAHTGAGGSDQGYREPGLLAAAQFRGADRRRGPRRRRRAPSGGCPGVAHQRSPPRTCLRRRGQRERGGGDGAARH